MFLSIFFRYRYSQYRCRYFIDISKKADISTIDIDISSKKHEKTLISAEKNGFFTKNDLIDIDIDIDIFKNVLIDIDIDIDIFKSDLIDIDIDIFKKCRYIDNRYGLSIYRTPLAVMVKETMTRIGETPAHNNADIGGNFDENCDNY